MFLPSFTPGPRSCFVSRYVERWLSTIEYKSEGCASAVKRILGKMDGVTDVQTNVEAKTVVVTANDSVSPQAMLEKLQKVRRCRAAVSTQTASAHTSRRESNVGTTSHHLLSRVLCLKTLIFLFVSVSSRCHHRLCACALFSGVLRVESLSNWHNGDQMEYWSTLAAVLFCERRKER